MEIKRDAYLQQLVERKDNGKYYILLDEVQFMPRFEEVLNSLLRMSNVDIYVTGSNSKFLSSDIVTEFRGRTVIFMVIPVLILPRIFGMDGMWLMIARYVTAPVSP